MLGVITSCTIDSSLTSTDGVFNKLTTVPPTKKGDPPTTEAEPNTVLPKLIEISINFSPIHEKTLGYNANNNNFGRFPYGVQLSPPPAEGVGIPKGVQEKVKLKRTLEEARQTAASAQQDIDKAEANFKKAKKILNSMERRGEITEAQRNKWTTQLRRLNVGDAEFDAATAETAYEKELAGYSEFL